MCEQDKEDEVLKRDFSAPTLEDHFNKTVLPKVMQVCVSQRLSTSQSALSVVSCRCSARVSASVH